MNLSMNRTTGIVAAVVVVGTVALGGWLLAGKRGGQSVTEKPTGGSQGSATTPPANAPLFKGDPSAVPASGSKRGGKR